MCHWFLAALLLGQTDGPGVEAEQFLRLMHAAHAPLRDVAFVFEGRSGPIEPADHAGADPVVFREISEEYQGDFAYRAADEASLLDVFRRSYEGWRVRETRKLIGLFQRVCTESTLEPDRPGGEASTRPGSAGSLNMPGSPVRIFHVWYFNAMTDARAAGYEFLGWEDQGGHRCLKVQFNAAPGPAGPDPEELPRVRFWIDMDRGGHPLRIDYLRGQVTRMRTVDIQLTQVPLPNAEPIWFPVAGTTEIFPYAGLRGPYKRPVAAEVYSVVNGTIRINQGLPDRLFRIDHGDRNLAGRDLPQTPALERLRKTFRKPPPRNDPAGIAARLEKQLAEADAESERVTAPSPAAARARRTWTAQILLTACGALAIGIGAWKLRTR